jgi:hypothetical protein
MLFGSSPFIEELRCQAIQMEHGPYIAERTQKVVYIVYGLGAHFISGILLEHLIYGDPSLLHISKMYE